MKRSAGSLQQAICAALACVVAPFVSTSARAQSTDTPFLAGIHWYHSDTNSTDVEEMSGGRPVWVVEQALLNSTATTAALNPWETPWVTSPSVDKMQPYFKVQYMQAVTAKGHTGIMRLHPFWGVNVPYPGDPYTSSDFADDCKAAASLMKNIHVWQIGNEANLNGENMRWNEETQRYDLSWPDAELDQLPELYAQTYVACREKIHQITPQTSATEQIVLMQPCSPGAPSSGTRFMSSDEFLVRMIAAVPDKSKIDGFALHGYAAPGGANAIEYMEDIRRQIALIDQAGLGDRPIFITEFNKHMPNATEARSGAIFLNSSMAAMNTWNTGAPALWPSQPNHPIRSASWFVYRADAGWDDYSLACWKTASASTLSNENPWYAFQASSAQQYPAGTGDGPIFISGSPWWSDSFSSPGIDSQFPLPAWDIYKAAGTVVTASGGEAHIAATGSFQLAGLRHMKTPFADFSMELEFTITDAAPVATGEANVDLRFRQTDADGPGFSLTFYSSQSTVRPNEVWLRKTTFWDTIYKTGALAGGISTGDRFTVQLRLQGNDLAVRVLRHPDDAVVLDWTGTNATNAADFRVGGIGIATYNLKEARVQEVRLGGPDMLNFPSSVTEWVLYD